MKKVWYGIAATALAGVMCVGLVGCGDSTDAKKIKGYEVTEEQWTAAFEALEGDDAVFTVNVHSYADVSMDIDLSGMGAEYGLELGKMSGGAKGTMDATYIKNGAKEYAKESMDVKLTGDYKDLMEVMGGGAETPEGKTTTESYAELTEDGYVTYEKDEDGEWTKFDGYSVIETSQWLRYKNYYNEFTYSASDKGYIPSDYDAEEDGDYVVIKFDKDGKLAAIYMEQNDDTEESGMTIKQASETHVVFSYTAKSITLPTVAEAEEEE